ncbi:RING/U-box superfamily protein, putative isoform 2 [Hibiscus syriacus]|uniref:RING-type E3 ubiquitin transferase n=1 Tax=Hibiscus syriacus TaxID=106335 RepID=A0A6A3D0G1_HIBSY|nr:RING/U-box superfamily protein, putative isoform 2 [Hibiscus syriacus]
MDGYSGKRAVYGPVVHGKESGRVLKDCVNNREQNAQFCTRIGCSGRLNSSKSTPNGCLDKAKSSRPYHSSSSGKQLETDSSETSSLQDKPEVTVMGVGSSSVASNSRPRRKFIQRSGLGNQDTLASPSVTLGSQSTSQGSSSTKGKKLSGSNSEGWNNSSGHGVSISDSRRGRNWPPNRDSVVVASVRTRRSNSSYVRGRLPNQSNRNSLTLNESPAAIPHVPQSDIPNDLSASVSTETVSTRASPYSQSGIISEGLCSIMQSSPPEVGTNHTLENRDSFRHYNMDGIAESSPRGEALLALQRVEQDEELTYEQLLDLETSLFLNGLDIYDQHRKMSLDIDNMSYEELLALEERMGDVNTGLSEDALSNCLKKSVYNTTSSEYANTSCDGEKDDVKCSVCQEEYVIGDEVGRLQC